MWALLQGYLLLLLFIAASAIDIKRREIPDSICVLIALTGFFTFSPMKFFGILIALPFLIAAIIYKGRMGGGDIKFMAAVGFAIGFDAAVVAAIIGLTASLIYSAVVYLVKIIGRKTEREWNIPFPLAPFLSIGCIAAFILTNGGLII